MVREAASRESGFTLLETMISLSVVIPILLIIGATSSTASQSIETSSRAADVNTACRRMSQRLAKLIRPAKLSTVEVPAVTDDVTTLLATSVGEWISPTDLAWRPGLQFLSATGQFSMNAALSTTPRRIVFELDSGETDNDQDDDGDGLIDEGRVLLLQNGITLAILRDVEECTFMFDGRLLSMRLRIARRAADNRIYRSEVEQQFYLRNN